MWIVSRFFLCSFCSRLYLHAIAFVSRERAVWQNRLLFVVPVCEQTTEKNLIKKLWSHIKKIDIIFYVHDDMLLMLDRILHFEHLCHFPIYKYTETQTHTQKERERRVGIRCPMMMIFALTTSSFRASASHHTWLRQRMRYTHHFSCM